MTPVVLDASIALSLVLQDEVSASAERLLRESADTKISLVTVPHWPLEVANGLLQASRRRRISPGDRLIAFDFLFGLPVTIDDVRSSVADLFALADKDRLSIYDAAYLELAIQRNAFIATGDSPLRRAARRRGLLWT